MKKSVVLTVMLLVITLSLKTFGQSSTLTDEQAVKAAALNYIEGWYEGSVERMTKALHPDLAKRYPQFIKQNGRATIEHMSANTLIEYTRIGFGKLKEGEEMENRVTILDIDHNIASVKVVSKDFVDYLHIVKANDEWRIINVLWEPIKE